MNPNDRTKEAIEAQRRKDGLPIAGASTNYETDASEFDTLMETNPDDEDDTDE